MSLDQILVDRGVRLFRGPAGHDKQHQMMREIERLMDGRAVIILDFKAAWNHQNHVKGTTVLQFPDPDTVPDTVRQIPRGSVLALDGVQFMTFRTLRADLPVGWQVRYLTEALDAAAERDITVFATWSEV